TDDAITQAIDQAVARSIEVVTQRARGLGIGNLAVDRRGVGRFLITAKGVDDPKRLIDLVNRVGKLELRLLDESVRPDDALRQGPPPTSEVLYSANKSVSYLVEKRVIVSGESIVDAQAGIDRRTNEPVVNFRFDAAGARRFARATQENVGRPF